MAAFAGKSLPTGWLLCDGSAVDRTLYSALFTAIGTTYGSGDGSTTFNLPNLIDKFVEGSATAGTVKSAGLPNITGGFKTRPWGTGGGNVHSAVTGAFQPQNVSTTAGSIASDSTGTHVQGITLDASRSSSIYGNSNTVQPPALTMRFAIYSGAISKKLWLRTA